MKKSAPIALDLPVCFLIMLAAGRIEAEITLGPDGDVSMSLEWQDRPVYD